MNRKNTPAANQQTSLIPSRKAPAWLMSVIVHGTLLVVLALTIRGDAGAGVGIGDPDRAGSIVLAKRSENNHPFEYFDESDTNTDSSKNSAAAAAGLKTNTTEPPASLADALPNDHPPTAPDLELPGAMEPLTGSVDSANLAPKATYSAVGQGTKGIGSGIDEQAIIDAERARLKGRGPQGPQATVSLFGGPPASGHSFVFVIDRSQSMGGDGLGAMAASAREFKAALEKLTPNHKFLILAYNHSMRYLVSRRLLSASDKNKKKALEDFDLLPAIGGTEHYAAIDAALRRDPDVIFLLTDGGPPQMTDGQLQHVQKKARGKTTIHCIQFGMGSRPDSNSFMKRLALQNGGGYGYVDMSAVKRP